MVIGLYLYKKYRKWKRKFSRISQNVLNWMNIPLLLWKEKFLLSVDGNLGHCKRPSLHATLRHGFIWLVSTFLIIWIQVSRLLYVNCNTFWPLCPSHLFSLEKKWIYGIVFFSNNEHFMGIPFYYKMLVEHKIIFTLKALLEELSHNESPWNYNNIIGPHCSSSW